MQLKTIMELNHLWINLKLEDEHQMITKLMMIQIFMSDSNKYECQFSHISSLESHSNAPKHPKSIDNKSKRKSLIQSHSNRKRKNNNDFIAAAASSSASSQYVKSDDQVEDDSSSIKEEDKEK